MEFGALAIGASLGALALVMVIVLLRRRSAGDMIERQKRESAGLLDNAPPPRTHGEVKPGGLRSDEAGLLAQPDIRAALKKGRKIQAIKLVRERAGLGLKEAKELVERAQRR